jgi:DNA helicase-2/ATP-dependent DNA helicase PcrA
VTIVSHKVQTTRALVRGIALVGPAQVGARVRHARFGEGVVLNFEGDGAHARVQVNFHGTGTKWLVVAYANLQPL